MSTTSNSNVGHSEPKQEVLEPTVRLRRLVDMSHNISVDRNISISKYFNSGRELIKSASALESKGETEKAFVLYLRYMTLFLEKLVHHPEYNKADRNEKKLVKDQCNLVFDTAEKLKELIMKKYEDEYEKYKQTSGPESGGEKTKESMQKRSVDSLGSSRHDCDIDEIDKKFDFSQTPAETKDKVFDPFKIEQLKQSFDN